MTNISAIDPIFWCFFRGRASLGIHVDTSTRSHLLLIQDQLLLALSLDQWRSSLIFKEVNPILLDIRQQMEVLSQGTF